MSFNKIKKGPMIANHNLNVAGSGTFNNMITAMSSLNVSGNTTMMGPSTTGSTLNIAGILTAANTSILSGASTMGSTLFVSGNSILQGASTYSSTLNIIGALTAASSSILVGSSTCSSTLNVSGNTTMMGPVTTVSSLNVSGNSILSGASTHSSTLFVTGAVTTNSSLNISGNTIINGSSTFLSNLNVSGVANIGNTPLDTSTALSVNNQIKLMEYGLVSTATTSYSTITENTATTQTSRYMGSIPLPAGFVDGSGMSVVMIGTRGPSYSYIEGGSYIQDTTDTTRFIQLVYGNAGTSGAATITGSVTTPLTASMFPLKVYKYAAYPGWYVYDMTVNVTINYNASATGISSSFQQISTQGTYNISDNRSTSSRLYFNSVGNIGIGNTAPSALLHVSGTSILNGASTHGSTLNIMGALNSSSTSILYGASTAGSTFNIIGSLTASSTSILSGASTHGSTLNIMGVLTAAGTSVFSGASTHVSTLYISGATTLNSTLNIVSLDNVTVTTTLLNFKNVNGYGIYADSQSIGARGNTLDFKSYDFNAIGTTTTRSVLTMRPEGNIGIGTNNPLSLLQFGNTVTNRGIVLWDNGTSSSDHQYYGFGINSNVLRYQTAATTTSHLFYAANSATTSSMLMSINGTGTVGIGTTSPNSILHLAKGVSTANDFSLMTTYENTVTGYHDWMIGPQILNNAAYFSIRGGNGDGFGSLSNTVFNINGNNGNLGLGNTNPGYKLDVTGDINFTGTLYNNGVAFSGGGGSSQWTTSGANIYYNNGNVGIGTTAPSGKLHVEGTTSIFGVSTGGSILIINDIPTARWRISTGGFALNFFKHTGTTTSDFSSWSQKMILDQNGNLGIGTTSPIATLHVNQASASGSGYGGLLVDSPNSGSAGGTITIRNSSGGVNAFASLIFEVDGTTSCGTGTTPLGFAQGNGMLYCMNVGSGGNNAGKLGFIQWDGSAEVETMSILPSGNVGIGTSSPSFKLHVYGNIDAGVEQYNQNASAGSSAYTLIGCRNNTPSQLVMFINSSTRTGDGGASTATVRNDAGDLRLQAYGATNGLHIKATTGYVGIGTTSANSFLDISGAARSGSHSTGRGLYVTSDCSGYANGAAEFRHSNGSQGIGIGYSGIYATGSNTNQDLDIAARGTGIINMRSWVGIGSIGAAAPLHISGGDNSKTYYGLNSSWGGALYVGSGTHNLSGGTAQVISTNGNLHLDPGTAGRSTYINYYTTQQYSASATTESYGTFNHRSNMNVDGSMTATQVYTNDWFRVNGAGGLYWQSYGTGIQNSWNGSNTYGNITTYGSGRNGWTGYGIMNTACFMTNGTAFGIHDNGNTWAFYVPNSGTRSALIMGSVQCSQYWDRLIVFANGYDTSSGYMYYNQGGGFGYSSDERIKKNIETTPIEQSVEFIKGIQPCYFCLKAESKKVARKTEDGEEVECEVSVCNCQQSGFIAQNVLESAIKSGVPKSVINNWYDYEQQIGLPEEERTAILGVSLQPMISHTVNVVKHLLDKVEQQQTIIDKQQTIIDNQKTEIDDMKMKMERMMAWAATMGFSG